MQFAQYNKRWAPANCVTCGAPFKGSHVSSSNDPWRCVGAYGWASGQHDIVTFATEAEARAHYLGQSATAAIIQPTADQAKKNLDKFLDSHLPKPKPAFDIFKINREFS